MKPALALIALGMAVTGCNRTSAVAPASVADNASAEATTRNAIGTVDAATNQALGAAQAQMDSVGHQAAPALHRAGERASADASEAKHKAGHALKQAGDTLDQ